MSATLEKEQEQAALQQAIVSFKMPKACMGEAITWYRDGQIAGPATRKEVAFVLKTGERTLVVRTASGIVYNSVRHIDDPRLKLSVEQRIDGAWDFTEEKKMAELHREELTETIKALTARVTALEKKKS